MHASEWKSKAQAAAYLAGLFDGEGTVTLAAHASHPGSFTRQIVIANADTAIVAACETALDQLGLRFKTYAEKRRTDHPNWQQLYRICLTGRENLERFEATVPFQHPAKRERLQAAIAGYRNRYRREDDIPVSRLRELYITRGEPIEAIAAAFDCSPSTIYRWLKRAGFHRDRRSLP